MQDVRFDKSFEARTSRNGVFARHGKILPHIHFNGTIREFLDLTILYFVCFSTFRREVVFFLVRICETPQNPSMDEELVCDSSGIRRLCFNTLAFQQLNNRVAAIKQAQVFTVILIFLRKNKALSRNQRRLPRAHSPGNMAGEGCR